MPERLRGCLELADALGGTFFVRVGDDYDVHTPRFPHYAIDYGPAHYLLQPASRRLPHNNRCRSHLVHVSDYLFGDRIALQFNNLAAEVSRQIVSFLKDSFFSPA